MKKVIIALVIVLAVYFLFFRKKAAEPVAAERPANPDNTIATLPVVQGTFQSGTGPTLPNLQF